MNRPASQLNASSVPLAQRLGAGPVPARLRVLLLEDDPIALSALKTIFGFHGCDVVAMNSVVEAIRWLKTERFDHMLLDLMLPDGEGSEVVAQARALGLTAKIVVASASCDEGLLARAKAAGPDVMMTKPLDLRTLFSALGIEMQRPA